MKRREHIEYGYVTFTGKRLARCQVDTYNAIQDRINSFLDMGLVPPERVVNGSHNMFRAIADVEKGRV